MNESDERAELERLAEKFGWDIQTDNEGQVIVYTGIYDNDEDDHDGDTGIYLNPEMEQDFQRD